MGKIFRYSKGLKPLVLIDAVIALVFILVLFISGLIYSNEIPNEFNTTVITIMIPMLILSIFEILAIKKNR